MTFKKRAIAVKFTPKGRGQRGSGEYSVDLTGHRCEVIIQGFGSGIFSDHLALRIHGMAYSDMDRFSTDALNALAVRNDQVTVLAGDEDGLVQQVFDGTISSAVMNLDAQPEVSFDVQASAGLLWRTQPASPNSFEGSVDVAGAVHSIARQMGFAFVNNGVTKKLANQYLCGSLMKQLETLCDAAGIAIHVGGNGSIAIWNADGGRDQLRELSPDTGLVGYPSFTTTGIRVRMEFDPGLVLGTSLDVTSSVKRANGRWRVRHVTHELSTQQPNGPWFTTADLTVQGLWVSPM